MFFKSNGKEIALVFWFCFWFCPGGLLVQIKGISSLGFFSKGSPKSPPTNYCRYLSNTLFNRWLISVILQLVSYDNFFNHSRTQDLLVSRAEWCLESSLFKYRAKAQPGANLWRNKAQGYSHFVQRSQFGFQICGLSFPSLWGWQ